MYIEFFVLSLNFGSVYILKNKLSTLEWKLKDVPLHKLVNPKIDLRYIRSPSFKARIRSSLLSLGIIEPLKVRSLPSGSYTILDGITRREDLAELGYSDSVPCLVTECTDKQALTLQCAFAFTRKNLDPMGFARYVKIKHDEGLTLTKIGEPFHLKKAQVSKYLALNKLSPENKLRVANRELSVDDAYAKVSKRRLPQNFEPKVKSKPCPWCGELVKDVWHAKTTLCPACDKRLTEAIKRERKFKQKKLDKVFPNKLLKL